MDSNGGIVFIILAVGIALAIVILQVHLQAQRRKTLAEFCFRMGWSFSADDPIGLSCCNGFKCLCEGYDQRAHNVMQGTFSDMGFTGFDYRYTTGSGKHRQVHHLSAVIAQARYPLKDMFIRPEGFGDRLAGMLGFDDIDFEWEEFNRAYYVKASDKAFAYDVINQKMMEYLMDNRGWSVQITGADMIVHTGSIFDADGFLAALNFSRVFLELLPDYLVDKLRGQ